MSTQIQAETVYDVLVHGAIGVEYLLQLDGAPEAGQTRLIEREIRRVGGQAANCALALAAWGARVYLTGDPLGNDGNGRFVAKELASVPNLTLHVPFLDDCETPYSVVLASANEPHSLLVRSEPVKQHDLENAQEQNASTRNHATWPSARLGACDTTSPHHLLRNMHDRGIPVIAQDVLHPVAPLAEVVLWPLSALSPLDKEERIKLACELARAWGNTIVGLLGVQSLFWCRAGEQTRHYQVLEIGDKDPLGSVGAVDVFHAGLLWSRLQGWDWERGLRFAAAAAALKCHDAATIPELGQIEAIV